MVAVEDQGPGISAADQRRAFQKFRKLSAQPTLGEPSTGNGLYLTKRYVEAMGGNVTIDSSLGKGSTFIVSLPLVTTDAVPETEESTAGAK